VHGSRAAGTAKGAGRQAGTATTARHVPAVLLSADLPVHRPPHNFTIRFPNTRMERNGQAAQLRHPFWFLDATMLATPRSSLVSLP